MTYLITGTTTRADHVTHQLALSTNHNPPFDTSDYHMTAGLNRVVGTSRDRKTHENKFFYFLTYFTLDGNQRFTISSRWPENHVYFMTPFLKFQKSCTRIVMRSTSKIQKISMKRRKLSEYPRKVCPLQGPPLEVAVRFASQ